MSAVSCTENETTPAPVDETNCAVSFGLGFGTSTGDAELFDNESKISNISIAVFEKGGSFHSVFTPKFDGEDYTFEIEEGNWKMWILANAQTPEALSGLLTETSRESDFLNLTVNGTVAKDRKIPMVSANSPSSSATTSDRPAATSNTLIIGSLNFSMNSFHTDSRLGGVSTFSPYSSRLFSTCSGVNPRISFSIMFLFS